jgi:hypothetical protein
MIHGRGPEWRDPSRVARSCLAKRLCAPAAHLQAPGFYEETTL